MSLIHLVILLVYAIAVAAFIVAVLMDIMRKRFEAKQVAK